MRINLKLGLIFIAVLFLAVDCQFDVNQNSDGNFSSLSLVNVRKTNFNFSNLFNPVPSELNIFFEKIDFYTGDIMKVTKLLVQIQGSLSSSFGLNTQVKNSSAATYLNNILQPHRTSFVQFFNEYSATPLYYKNIFKMFSNLNGTVDKIALLVNELSSVITISSELRDEIFRKLKILSSQDLNYFAVDESKNGTGLSKEVLNKFMVFLLDRNLINIRRKINESNQVDLKFFDHISIRPDTVQNREKIFQMIVNKMNKSQNFLSDVNQFLKDEIQFLDVNFLVEMVDLAPYLSCSFMSKISSENFVSNLTAANLIGSQIYNRLFKCNVKFVMDIVKMEKSATFSVSQDIKPVLVKYYLIYKMRMDNFDGFDKISTLISHIPADILEQFFLVSYLSDGSDPSVLSYSVFVKYMQQLKLENILVANMRGEISQLIQNHGLVYLNYKKFSTWTVSDWNLFHSLRSFITFDKMESLFNTNTRYISYLDLTNTYNTSYWLEDCQFTNIFYNYLIFYIRDTQNDTTTVTIDKTKSMVVCKDNCDFSAWLNENSTSSQVRSLVSNYLPLMSSYAKQMCKGTAIINAFKSLIMNLNTVSTADFDLIMSSGFELTTLFTNSEIKLLQAAVLKSFLPKISAMDFDKATARIILGKVFEDSDLRKYGNLIIGLDSSFLNSLSTETVVSNFKIFLDASLTADDYFKKIFIDKYFGSTFDKNKVIDILKTNRRDLIDLITLDRFIQVNFLLSDLESLSLPDGLVPNSILRYLIDEYLKSKPIRNWTLSDLKKANPIIFTGLTQNDVNVLIKNIGIDAIRILVNRDNQYSIPSNLLKTVVRGLIKNLMGQYGDNPRDYMKNIPIDIIDILNPAALLEFNPDEIKILSERPEFSNILGKLSKADLNIFIERDSPAVPQVYAKYWLEYIKKLRLSEGKLSAILEETDLVRLGPTLFKYLSLIDILSIPLCVLARRLDFFDSIEKTGAFSEEDGQKIEKFLNEEELKKCFPPQNNGRDGICRYIKGSKCPIIFEIGKGILQKVIPGFNNYVETAQCGMCAVRSIFQRRSCSSKCGKNLSKIFGIFKKPISLLINNVVNKIVNRVQNIARNIVKGIRRIFGKRDLSNISFTCDQIKQLGFSVDSLTYDDIIYMNLNEFENCLGELASYDGYTDVAYDAFRKKITELYNMTSINDEKIIEMGTLIKGFRPEEMNIWKIEKIDTLASIGSLNLTREQMVVFANVAKTLKNSAAPFNEFELISLGNIICGLDLADLRAIQNETIKKSIPTLSTLAYGCEPVIYQELFTRFKSLFGSSLWSRSRLGEIGILTCGISAQDINDNLNPDLISSFIPESFQKMNLDVLTKIVRTKEIYQSLDRTQLSQMQENKNFIYLDDSLKKTILNEFDGGYSKVLAEMQSNNTAGLNLNSVIDKPIGSESQRLKSFYFEIQILFATILTFLMVVN